MPLDPINLLFFRGSKHEDVLYALQINSAMQEEKLLLSIIFLFYSEIYVFQS